VRQCIQAWNSPN
jgi:hypothetical protein